MYFYLFAKGSWFQNGLCDCLKLLIKRELGKFDVSLLTFNRCVNARTRDNNVENKFSAVNNSKPSSSSSSPELAESFGSCVNVVERFVGRELLWKLLWGKNFFLLLYFYDYWKFMIFSPFLLREEVNKITCHPLFSFISQ